MTCNFSQNNNILSYREKLSYRYARWNCSAIAPIHHLISRESLYWCTIVDLNLTCSWCWWIPFRSESVNLKIWRSNAFSIQRFAMVIRWLKILWMLIYVYYIGTIRKFNIMAFMIRERCNKSRQVRCIWQYCYTIRKNNENGKILRQYHD